MSTPSHLFPHGRWLLCRPVDYDVRYKINPWMDLERAPVQTRALEQWTVLHHTLLRAGAWLEYVEQGKGVPDMVFTANGGLVKGRNVILPRFRFKERQGEEPLFKQWFETHGYRVHELKNGCFEGEGDALFAGERLVCGYGFRSDIQAYSEIKAILQPSDSIDLELVDPRFYHLDTCFCPLTPQLAIYYPHAFTAEGRKAIEYTFECIQVPEDEALKFVCNTVVLDRTLVMPAGCNETVKAVTALGYTVHQVELDEFIKAGGAAKCLSLKLEQ